MKWTEKLAVVLAFGTFVFALLGLATVIRHWTSPEAQASPAVAPSPASTRAAYYSEEQAVAFVRGWLSDIKVGTPPGPVNNCLYIKEGTLSDPTMKWSGTWTGSHWEVRLGPTMYEFWEEFWKVTSKSGGGC